MLREENPNAMRIASARSNAGAQMQPRRAEKSRGLSGPGICAHPDLTIADRLCGSEPERRRALAPAIRPGAALICLTGAWRVQAVGPSLVAQSKIKYLLPCASKTEFTG